MKNAPRSSSRRSFLKQSAVAAGGLLVLGRRAGAASGEPANPSADSNPALATLHRLRSTHGNFTAEDVPDDTLQAILDAGVRAANASNLQCYSIVVVRDRATMEGVCGYRGSRLLLFCADHNRLADAARTLGHPYHPDDTASFITALIDTTLAAQTAAIAARACGVDYLLTNGIHRGDMNRLWQLLDLPPRHCFPVIALVLGYPTQEPAFKAGRYTGPGLVHEGKYHAMTPPETVAMIRQYDDDARHLGLHYGGNWRAEGHGHYLDWLFTVWMGRPAKQTKTPTQMREIIQRLGYLDA